MSKPGRPSNEARSKRLDADRERKRTARAAQYAKRDPKEVAAKAERAKESAARTAATAERERNAIAARQAAAAAKAVKAAAEVRPVVRFQVPGIVDDANGVSRFTREYAAPLTMNPYEAPLPPRQPPYIPKPPPGCIVTRVPDPLPPGVVRQANGIRTVSRGNTGRSFSPFDIF